MIRPDSCFQPCIIELACFVCIFSIMVILSMLFSRSTHLCLTRTLHWLVVTVIQTAMMHLRRNRGLSHKHCSFAAIQMLHAEYTNMCITNIESRHCIAGNHGYAKEAVPTANYALALSVPYTVTTALPPPAPCRPGLRIARAFNSIIKP